MIGFPLAPQQKHLWSLDRGDPAFCAQCAVLLEGTLHGDQLERALGELVARHEILRTSFSRKAGMRVPLQVVAEAGTAAWTEIDLTAEEPAEQPAKIQEVLAAQRRSRGDGDGDPAPVAFSLLRLGPERQLLAMRLPALSADTRSLANLVRELGAGLAPGASHRDDDPVQYVQFSSWQNELLEDEEEAEHREYWEERIRRATPAFRLPFGGAPATAPGWDPGIHGFLLAPEQVAKMADVAREAEVGLPALLLACWQALLFWRTGRTELVVGCVFDGRKFEELEDGLGLFAKSIPLQATVEGSFRFRDLLRRVERALAEGEDLQEYFFWPTGAEEEAATVFPSAAYEWVEEPPAVQANGLRVEPYLQRVCIERFELKLLACHGENGLRCELQYDAETFREADARSFEEQLRALIDSALARPAATLGELSLLSAAERQRLVVEFNRTGAGFSPGLPVHLRFAEQVASRPHEPAVVCEDRRLTYGELGRRVDALARHLVERGVGPEVPVAIHLDRSPEMIVSLLAVLQAGGAYVPLDVTLPGQRVAALLADVRAPVVLTEAGRVEALSATAAEAMMVTDREPGGSGEPPASSAPSSAPEQQSRAENLAYVLFTSGSTGVPKGVAIGHRQLASYVDGVSERLALPPGSGYALVSTFGADLGLTVIFPALCSGGCLHVVRRQRTMDPEGMAEYFRQHEIDCLKIVPSHLMGLLTASRPEEVLPRRLLVLGGEASSRELVAQVRALAPDCRILNHYGPTETTVGVSTFAVPPAAEVGATLPLGRPLASSRLYVLDPRLRPVAAGIAGELHIGGLSLARGYLGRPAATAELFIPDPFSAEEGAGAVGGRLYKTGDLARFQPEGALWFLGRADHQIKIRGFRVELGEIEALLRQQPGVADAVVTFEEQSGGGRLFAYVVPAEDGEASRSALRDACIAALPEHMVPATFTTLESLPLNANGKVDRRALPSPDEVERTASEFIPSRSLGEEMMAGLWSEVLGREQVGVHDNFFALGGDSLQAIQLISRIRKVFDVELEVRSMFSEPTVAHLTTMVEAAVQGTASSGAPPLEPVPRDGELPLSYAQQRLWLMHQMHPESAAYNTPDALRLHGPLDFLALERAFSEIVRRHEVVRTSFPQRDGRPQQRIHPAEPVALPRVDLCALDGAARLRQARRVASQVVQQPFDLERGPMLRVVLALLEPESQILVISMHHIIADAWSKGILGRELAALYRAFSAGRPSPLADLPVQYADFAAWQRRWLAGGALEAQLAYWRKQLRGAPELLELPLDRPRPPAASFAGALISRQVPTAVLGRLRELCRREGVTLFMTLLAALKVLLGRVTRQEDLVVGTDVANRNRLEIEDLIGFFVNNLVLRSDLSGNPTFRELLARVRETTLGAFAHQDVPFEFLVRDLQSERSLHHTPLFQVLFVMQNVPRPRENTSGLAAAEAEFDFGMSKFDLSLFVFENWDGTLMAGWKYRTELFDVETIVRMAACYEQLLASIVEEPDAPLSKLEILPPEERTQASRRRSDRRRSRMEKLKQRRR